jgi:hypothetical protein
VLAQPVTINIEYTVAIPNPTGKLIFYNPGDLLTIAAFAGDTDVNSSAVAITSSGFAFKAGFKNAGGNATLIIKVYCSFDKQMSWMKPAGKNEYILQHEQQHFNISYLGAMEFMQQLKAATFTTDNYNKLIEKLYNQSSKNMEDLQQAYDGETHNGIIKEKQQYWNEKIYKRLSLIRSDVNLTSTIRVGQQ